MSEYSAVALLDEDPTASTDKAVLDRTQRKAAGRAVGSAGDIVYGAGVQVGLPVQVLSTVAVRMTPAKKMSLSVTCDSDWERVLIHHIAQQLPGGPWSMSINVASWFITAAGMGEEAATTIAAVRAFAAAAEIPSSEPLAMSVVNDLIGNGSGLVLPGMAAVNGAEILSHHEWIPELSVVTVIPVDKDRQPLLYERPATIDQSDAADLLAQFNAAAAARDTLGIVDVATRTAERSGHPSLELLDAAADALAGAGALPLGRIVSHQGPAVSLLFPGDVEGRYMATQATHALAAMHSGRVRVNCSRTPRVDV